MDDFESRSYFFPQVTWELEDLEHQGWVLDIGGGGEGVIGQLLGEEVVAIDLQKEELLEAADGPLKIFMDARDLKFLDDSFHSVTAFFSLMYLKEKDDQQKVFQEVARVLSKDGKFHIWDVDLSQLPQENKEFYVIRLRYKTATGFKDTGYGMRWPEEPRQIEHYLALAESVGLVEETSRREEHTFYLCLRKI
jgi:ubiquinone/menaquinone biosynthesis C-methylase UbiE